MMGDTYKAARVELARVYAHGPNAFWYMCTRCGGRGYTEEGYDITYADMRTLQTSYVCETCYER